MPMPPSACSESFEGRADEGAPRLPFLNPLTDIALNTSTIRRAVRGLKLRLSVLASADVPTHAFLMC